MLARWDLLHMSCSLSGCTLLTLQVFCSFHVVIDSSLTSFTCPVIVFIKTAGKWQKCNLVSGMASVASNMGWL